MELDWFASDPETGRLSHTRRTTVEEYVARIEVLRELGEGYTEVNLADRPYPCLTFGFRRGYGVIHQFAAEDTVFLLSGDRVIGDEQRVRIRVLDDVDSEWTGKFILTADRAWAVVMEFLRHGSVESLGRWEQL